MLKENTKAPEFNLIDQNNQSKALFEFQGKLVVLYFYPRDDSPACTREAENFRDHLDKFEEYNIEIVGISPDPPSNHKKFVQKYNLSFTLLSDPTRETIKKYGARGLVTKRITYLINPEGMIIKAYSSVSPGRHAEDILNDLRDFNTY